MSLDTNITDNPDSMYAAAAWLRSTAERVHDTQSQVYGARGQSESGWQGQAGDNFRVAMTNTGNGIGQVSTDLDVLCRAITVQADDTNTIKAQMRQALDIARQAGLHVEGTVIKEPGPAPADPTPLPTDKPPTPEQQKAHVDATQAQSAYAAKAAAYIECSKVVLDANNKLTGAYHVFGRTLSSLIDKSPFNFGDIITGLAGEVSKHNSKYRGIAQALTPGVNRAIEYAASRVSPKTIETSRLAKLRAMDLALQRIEDRHRELGKVLTGRVGSFVDKLPSGVCRALELNFAQVSGLSSSANSAAKLSARILSKFPVVGFAITLGGIGYDIGSGKDAGTSVVSGLSGYAAGALTTAWVASCGGPIGWAVAAGAVASIGVGFVIEEWDAVSGAIGDVATDFANGVCEAANDFATGVSGAISDVGEFLDDLF